MTSERGAPVEIPAVTAGISGHHAATFYGRFVDDVYYEAGDSRTETPTQRKSASVNKRTGLLLYFDKFLWTSN